MLLQIVGFVFIFIGIVCIISLSVWTTNIFYCPTVSKNETQVKKSPSLSNSELLSTMDNKKTFFATFPPTYLSIVAQTIIPSNKCCGMKMSIKKNVKDSFDLQFQSFYATFQWITIGNTSFYSLQVRSSPSSQKWYIESLGNRQFRFYQLMEKEPIYISLSLDKKNVLGLRKNQTNASQILIVKDE